MTFEQSVYINTFGVFFAKVMFFSLLEAGEKFVSLLLPPQLPDETEDPGGFDASALPRIWSAQRRDWRRAERPTVSHQPRLGLHPQQAACSRGLYSESPHTARSPRCRGSVKITIGTREHVSGGIREWCSTFSALSAPVLPVKRHSYGPVDARVTYVPPFLPLPWK